MKYVLPASDIIQSGVQQQVIHRLAETKQMVGQHEIIAVHLYCVVIGAVIIGLYTLLIVPGCNLSVV